MKSDEVERGAADAEMINQSTFGDDENISKVKQSKSVVAPDVDMLDQSQSSPQKLALTKSYSISQTLSTSKSQVQRTQEEGGYVADTFIGSLKSILQYRTSTGEQKNVVVEDMFIEVMVSALKTKNMYEAWEDMYQNQIEGYQSPEGEITNATKVDWITKLPSVFSI